MATKVNKVEMILKNGNPILVAEHMVKELTRFGASLAISRSIKTPPRELLNMPQPRKVVIPALAETKVIEPAPIPASIPEPQAQYPDNPEPDTVQPIEPIKKVVKKSKRRK